MGWVIGGPFVLLAAVLLVAPIALWYAFVAATLWGWFVVPTFQAPVLSTWQMWGVVLTIAAIRPRLSDNRKDDRPVDWSKIGGQLLGPAILLGIGAVLKFWII